MKKILLLIAILFALNTNAQIDTSITVTYSGRINSGYTPNSCGTECLYTMPVVLPREFTITDIRYTFFWRASSPCFLNQGGFEISLDSCKSGCKTGPLGLPGLEQASNLSLYSSLSHCLPGPDSSFNTLNFVLNFWRTTDSVAGCNSSCIVGDPDSTWRITVSGRMDTMPVAYFTLSPDTTQLHHYIAINLSYGIPPLSYDWSWGDGTHDYTPYPTHTYADSGFYNICLTVTDSAGRSDEYCDTSFHILRTTDYMVTVNVIPPLLTGTTDKTNVVAAFNIFPNPATGLLTIHTSSFHNEAVTLSVVNMLGQTMMKEKLTWNSDESINIKSLSAGIYFVQVSNDSNQRVGKFVKE